MPVGKSGPPKHANKEKFIPSRADKHNTKQNLIDTLPDDGCCKKCSEIIEWKKQYGKYKPLKTPAKCTGCHQRIIMLAYHQLCENCLRNKNACPKCMVVMEPEEAVAALDAQPKKPAKARQVDRPLERVGSMTSEAAAEASVSDASDALPSMAPPQSVAPSGFFPGSFRVSGAS